MQETQGISENVKYNAEFSNENLYLTNETNEKVIYDFYSKMYDANEYRSLQKWMDELEIPKWDGDSEFSVYERLQYIIKDKFKE